VAEHEVALALNIDVVSLHDARSLVEVGVGR
jgi:hypothetical protein